MKIISGDQIGEQKWDEFVRKNSSDFGLLQSWDWGEFNDCRLPIADCRFGNILRLAMVERGEMLAVASIIKMPLKLGKSYFYIPRGPIIKKTPKHKNTKTVLDLLFSEIKNIAKKENCIFLRLDPAWSDNQELKKFDFRFVGQVQPKQTLILDLSQSEEELLSAMKSKTRYNIKVAQKHKVEVDEGEKYFEDFWRLTEKTSSRQEIKSHPKNYYHKLVEKLEDKTEVVVAKHKGQVIVANIMASFGDWAVYLHGASDYKYRKVMAPYLLQWEAIRRAKIQGRKFYDFWGVDEQKWPGVTRFKKGFAPQTEFTQYIGAWDYVYNKLWYNLYKMVKNF